MNAPSIPSLPNSPNQRHQHTGTIAILIVALLALPVWRPATSGHTRVSEVPLCRPLSCLALGPADEVYGWDYHSLVLSFDHGETWQTVRTFPDSVGCRGLFVNSAGSVFLGLTRVGRLCVGHPGSPWVWDEPLVYECSLCSPNTNNSAMWKMCEDADGDLYVGEYGGAWFDTCAFIHKSHDGGLTWTTVYEGTGRHIHFVRFDPWQNAIYAGMGDGVGRQHILRSMDGGAVWDSLSITGCLAQPTDAAFTATHRIFGSDCGTTENCIYRTCDDETLEAVLPLEGPRDAYVWDMAGNSDGFLIAGTRAKLAEGSAVALYASCDGGASWAVLKELGVLPPWSGVSDITRLDSNGHVYYACWDPANGCHSYRLTLDPTSEVHSGSHRSVDVSISCASPCSESATIVVASKVPIRHADITIHNLAGRRIAALHSGPLGSGATTMHWYEPGGRRLPLPSGVYFVRLRADTVTARAAFVLVR